MTTESFLYWLKVQMNLIQLHFSQDSKLNLRNFFNLEMLQGETKFC